MMRLRPFAWFTYFLHAQPCLLWHTAEHDYLRRKVVRHVNTVRTGGRWLQVRLATHVTCEQYITGKLWRSATLVACPWHPEGGCGFARHGTYQRVKPANVHVARWYCPRARRTVSALPDCLASHRSGTLDECEDVVRAVEQAPSHEAACWSLRTDINLPGALRYLARMVRDVYRALSAIKGLLPTQFTSAPTITGFAPLIDSPNVLMALRDIASRHLPFLPTPLGFNPSPFSASQSRAPVQHWMGRDPPVAFIDPSS